MGFASSLTQTATTLISKYGNTGILEEITQTPDSYVPSQGKAQSTVTPYTVKYFKENYSSFEIEKGLYGINDFKATMVYPKDIQKNWRLDGAEIINVTIVQTQDTTVVQELQCRR